ncbi:hypothetical protein DPMN_159533 [Dreissena polymorpha]|uniref:Uncharacterized protein n=1 Tax=Dreissena polymorpha TaxID=45954 RepID=A0A9D4ELS7_DREPO|nr:hypothetical protein DPMN_159533 [Dreissena polymorpha]
MKYIKNRKDLNGWKGRWTLKIQGYNFTIAHKAGKKNAIADALSRRTYDQTAKVSETQNALLHVNGASQDTLMYSTPDDCPLLSALDIDDDAEEVSEIDLHDIASDRINISQEQWERPTLQQLLNFMVHNVLPKDDVQQKENFIMSDQYIIKIISCTTFVNHKGRSNKTR